MPEAKPDLQQVAEAMGGDPKVSGESSKESKFDQDRAAFAALEGKYGAEDKPKPKPKRSPKKKSTPEAQASEEPQLEDVTPDEDVREVEEPKVDETPESKKAREFLKLKASAPSTAIDSLTPSEATEWAASLAKNEADVQRAFLDRAELQKEVEGLKEAATKSEPTSAVPADDVDFGDLETRLSEHLGDEAGKTIAETFKQTLTPYQARIDQLEATIQQAREENTQKISETNRERVGKKVERLKESDRAWQAVEREVIAMATEAKPGEFSSVESMFDEAVKVLYGDNVFEPKKPVEDVEEKKARIKSASPETQSRKPAPRKLSPKESDLEVFKHLEKNPGDIRGAQRVGKVTA